jgi:hypothetical protein
MIENVSKMAHNMMILLSHNAVLRIIFKKEENKTQVFSKT